MTNREYIMKFPSFENIGGLLFNQLETRRINLLSEIFEWNSIVQEELSKEGNLDRILYFGSLEMIDELLLCLEKNRDDRFILSLSDREETCQDLYY